MTITAKTSQGECPIQFLPWEAALQQIQPGDAAIIDSNVAAAHPQTAASFSNPFIVPAGESSKSLEVYGECVRHLAQNGITRSSRVWAIGGGVTGDLAGFAAASILRGVPLIQVPTSLLAMVDSSVGGKVGIDLPEGKNLVGAFWQPRQVLVDLDFLRTLPHRHMVNGMAEVWKYAFIGGGPLLDLLRGSQNPPMPEVVELCIRHKANVVEQDEFERSGLRASLNFGHTIGHAIEQVQGYRDLLHGEAIAIGMAAETAAAEAMGISPQGLAQEIAADLAGAGLPTRLPIGLTPLSLLPAMRRDKKRSSSGLAFSLLTKMGQCKLYEGIPEEVFMEAFSSSCSS